MKMRKLVTIKPHKYGTRHLTAGEEYEAPPRHAIALVAGRKARFADKSNRALKNPALKPAVAAPQAVPDVSDADANRIDSLRMEANQIGLAVDGRWGVARLQHEIAQAKR
jgi:hypothetical protein